MKTWPLPWTALALIAGWLAGFLPLTSPAQNVGIGTTAPSSQLDVTQKAEVNQLQVKQNAQQDYILQATDNSGNLGWTDPANLSDNDWQRDGGQNELYLANNSDNVGIGDTDPNDRLEVRGNARLSGDDRSIRFFGPNGPHGIEFTPGTTNELNVYYRTSPNNLSIEHSDGTELLTVDRDNKRVGVNTINPQRRFHVRDVARFGNVGGLNTNGQGSFQSSSSYSGDGYAEAPFVYTTFIEAIDERGGGATGIAVGADNSFTGNDEISLITNGDEQLRVNYSGNVGIGTTSPNYNLEVTGQVYARTQITAHDPSFGRDLALVTTGGRDQQLMAYSNSNSNADLALGIDGSTYMFIQANGNVGVGTTNPSGQTEIQSGANDDAILRLTKKVNSPDEYGIIMEMDGDGGDDALMDLRAQSDGAVVDASNSVFYVDGDGRLALGKNYDIGTGPSHQLEVDGQVQISGGGPSSGDFLKSTNGNGSATWASISEGDVSGVIENVSAGNDINVNGGNSGTQTVAVEKAIDIEESLYENLEETDVNASIGNVYFDKNFDNAGESGDGNYFGDGGGFVAYNETGWGAIVTDENMEHLSAKLYGLHVGGTENPGEDVARIGNVGTLNSPGQGSFQNNSNYSGDGYTETPFVYTSFIEAIDERGGGATGIAVGADNSFTGNDEISLITTGDEQLRVNPDGNVGIHTTGANKANLHVDVDSDERGVHVEGNWDGVSGIVRSMLVKNNGHSSGGAKYRAIQGAALGNTSSSGRTHGVFGKGGGRDLNIGVYGKLASGTGAGVYATTSGANLDLENNTYAAFFNGDVTWTGSHSSTSDRRLKKDISPLKNNLAKVMQLGVYAYRFKDHEMLELGDGKQYGFIAQEVEQVAPALVENNIGGDYKGLNQLQIMPLLAGAIQEQQQLHQDKDQRIQELKQRVQKQQQQIEQLQQAVQELQGQARR